MFSLPVAFGTAAVFACGVNPTICSETSLAPNADMALERKECLAKHGTPLDRCPGAVDATCAFGDSRMIVTTTGMGADEREGTLRGARKMCHSAGGTFSIGGRPVAADPPSETKSIDLEVFHYRVTGLSDCAIDEDDMLQTSIACGVGTRPPVRLKLQAYPAAAQGYGPPSPDESLAETNPPKTVVLKEGKRTQPKRKNGPWRVEFQLKGRHGIAARGFHEVRDVGGEPARCIGYAWSDRDLVEASKMCASVTRTK